MLNKSVILVIFLAELFKCQDASHEIDDESDIYGDEGYDDYGSGDEQDDEYDDSGSGPDYDYDYDYDREDRGSGDFYDYETKYEDSALDYIPEITSRSLSLAVRPGEKVKFPCEAKDAEKFVRVWMKDDVMLFTGNIRLNQDERLSLEGNSSLVIMDTTPEDSGQYECRIMVRETVSISHTLIVTQSFSIQADPSEGVVMVPLRGSTHIGCKIVGDSGSKSGIVWSRDNNKFRDGSYSFDGESIQLGNISLEDAGYYYCTAQGPDGATKTASIQVQVLFPPEILSIHKSTLQSGKGFEAEITCVVNGEPRPRVIWYKGGEVITLTGRMEAQRAGTKQILLIHNIQEGDYGSYMCYASNSIGSVQKIIELNAEHKINKEFGQTQSNGKQPKSERSLQRNYKILKRNLDKDRKTLINFKNIMEHEIQNIRNELSVKHRKSGGMEDSFEQAILADLERLEDQYRSLMTTLHGYETKLEVLERNFQDDSQRVWDSLNELQELTNITTRNIEDIYDKDILRLQNFQNLVEGDLNKMKHDIQGALNNGAVGFSMLSNNDDFEVETKIYGIEDTIKKIINKNRNNQNLYESFRDDMNNAFADIDELKKEKQANAIEIEQLKRYITQLEVEKIEENMVKIDGMGKIISNLESTVGKASQKMRKFNKQSGGDEKVGILLKEVQNMKNQMFFLQQSVIQLRTQEHLALEVAENEVGPAYNYGGSADLAQVKTDMDMLSNKIETIENLLNEKQWVEKDEFMSRNQYIEQRIEGLGDKIEDAGEIVDACEEKSRTIQYTMIDINSQLERVKDKQEESDQERVKYFLLFGGMKKRRKLERPFHVMNLITQFIETTLNLKDINVEEAYRVQEESGKRPFPIRIKFSNLKDRNIVLTAGRQSKTGVKISEEFTENVKNARKQLAAFARQKSRETKSRWALQEDKLYFNKKIYVFNEESSTVEPISDIS